MCVVCRGRKEREGRGRGIHFSFCYVSSSCRSATLFNTLEVAAALDWKLRGAGVGMRGGITVAGN